MQNRSDAANENDALMAIPTNPTNANREDIADLLIEIGTEELPPVTLDSLAESFEKNILSELEVKQLHSISSKRFVTPRRIALFVQGLTKTQPDHQTERRGPALTAAYDSDGNPTKAAEGFARSCGVDLSDLQIRENDKGAWLVYLSSTPGIATIELIPQIVSTALAQLPIPRRMRWGSQDDEFIRPVHWVLLLFGDQVIPATILGVRTGGETYGHRFHHPDPILVSKPSSYQVLLESEGKVCPDFAKRREIIRTQIEMAAAGVDGNALLDLDLLDEVTALVEWPVALVGKFESRFLDIPSEVLISTMQDHQKYFAITDGAGCLLPFFITIANLESRDPNQVITGNERVIRPRFADAEFFWSKDRKQRLSNRIDSLKAVIFQQQLGTLYDKSERISNLARYIAQQCGGNLGWSERAARLAKCDLLTDMVQEFPNLQGIMGRYYALHDGEASEVALALEEQYKPRFAGDELPRTVTGQAIALADRLDTLVGIYSIGQSPSGTKDPFGLRRAALGVSRIIIEKELELDLYDLVKRSLEQIDLKIVKGKLIDEIFDFMLERLRSYYLDHGITADAFDAVFACRPVAPVDFDRRIRAVVKFKELPDAVSLTATNKRVRNLLKKFEGEILFEIKPELLKEKAEQILANKLAELSSEVIRLYEVGLYFEGLSRLASLREFVDAFFDQVMVMTDDSDLRLNRIAMLKQMDNLFLRVADFSHLQL